MLKSKNVLKFQGYIQLLFRNRSDLFLLSYLVFLIVSLCLILLDADFNYNTIGAMIIASVIFSFAELFYSLDSIKKDALSIEIEAETIQSEAIIKLQTDINKLVDQSCKSKEDIYRDSFCIAFQPNSELPELEKEKLLEEYACKKARYEEILEENRKEIQRNKEERHNNELFVEALKEDISYKKVQIQRDPIFANAMMFIGILVFLVLLVINEKVAFDSKTNSVITVLAFVVLVLNYYIRRIYTSLIREDLKIYKEHAQYYLDKNSNQTMKKSEPPIIPHKLYSQRKR